MLEMVQFLAQMPTETKIFLGMAVLGLTGTLIVLKWLARRVGRMEALPSFAFPFNVARRFSH
jgi:hypothetical protein